MQNEDKDNQTENLKQQLYEEKQINIKTKDYLLLLESKVVEFDNQKEIIKSLNSEISQLKKEIQKKDNEINMLKQNLESAKLTEDYIIKILDLRKNLDEI